MSFRSSPYQSLPSSPEGEQREAPTSRRPGPWTSIPRPVRLMALPILFLFALFLSSKTSLPSHLSQHATPTSNAASSPAALPTPLSASSVSATPLPAAASKEEDNKALNVRPTPSTPTLSSSYNAEKRANATLLILVSPRSVLARQLLPTLENIESSFNRRLGYPIQLLTDGSLPSEEMMERTRGITGGKAKWALIEKDQGWGEPDWVSKEDIEYEMKEIGFAEGYLNMCRFYSGFFWKHPSVAPFDYIWRLDEGVKFWCDLDYDPFMVMQETGKRLGYSVLRRENQFVVEGLWDTSKALFAAHPEYVAEDNNLRLISQDGGESWDQNRMIYNNFEISHRSIWESEAYSSYFSHIDHTGNIYRGRWGDAPIHTIGLAYTIPASDWIDFGPTTGYQHGSGQFTCPKLPQCSCAARRSQPKNGSGKRPAGRTRRE